MAALGSLALSGTAEAHTDLTSSVPTAGISLRVPPALVRLKFNEAINKDFANLTLTIGTRGPVALQAEVSGGTVTSEVPARVRSAAARTPQRWRVAYRVVSEDGHPVTGSVTFTVTTPSTSGPSPSTAPSDETSPAATGGPAEPDLDPGHDESSVRGTGQVPEPGASAWVPTAIIGLITASVSGAAIIWLVRGRRQDQRE